MARKRQTAAQKRAASARRSRRGKTGTNLLQVAETYMLLNAITQGAFRTSPIEFIMTPKGFSKVGADSTWVVSLPEILKMGTSGAAYGGVKSDTLMEVVKSNLGMNDGGSGNRGGEWIKVAGQMIAIPLAFRFGKRLAKPALTRTRKLLKDAGLKGTVTV